jgi:glycosyltransferase involved in cell wall biosynthesis
MPYDGSGLALVLEQAADLGGQERVVEALLRHYTAADAVALRMPTTNRPEGRRPWWQERIREIGPDTQVRRRGWLVPLYSRRMARVQLADVELALSVTHGGWSLMAQLPPGARHVCYSSGLNTAIYAQSHLVRRDETPLVRPLLRLATPLVHAHLRRLMERPNRVIANSHYSAAGLAEAYGGTFEVLYPPVRTDFFTPGPDPTDGRHFLFVARLNSHKRIDLVVEAFRQLDEELLVAGGGPSLARLRAGAPPNVTFLGPVYDDELLELYRSSKALVCPSVETFGIAMCEALACGKPVIAVRRGGALEIVRDGRTGLLLDDVTAKTVAGAVRVVAARSFDPGECRRSVERFSEANFIAQMDELLLDEFAKAAFSRRENAAA